jgi:hypothetical protein
MVPWIAVAIRTMRSQKCRNRRPWPMITPHSDEINQRNPKAIGIIEGYRRIRLEDRPILANRTVNVCVGPVDSSALPLVLPGWRYVPLRIRGRGTVNPEWTSGLSPNPIIMPRVVRERIQPNPEAAVRIVAEVVHADRQVQEHFLGYILRVGLLKSPSAAPDVDPSAVPVPVTHLTGARDVAMASRS